MAASNRAEKMGRRAGLAGWVDRLRYHELSRQGLGLLLLPLSALLAQPGNFRILAGLAIAAVGQIWRIYAAGVIYKNQQLATTGAYSLVRHPLYLGNFLILAGFCLASGNLVILVAATIFLVFYYPAAIRYEDHKLERIFSNDWRAWSSRTPAMFPRHFNWLSNPTAKWNARQSLKRNGELAISIYLVGCAAWLLHRSGVV